MTNKERAMDYAYARQKNLHLSQRDTNLIQLAYLHGLEDGLKWHDLRKDPNDVPDNYRSVWTNVGAGYHDDDGWWDDFGRLQNVVAWCEPKFEEATK